MKSLIFLRHAKTKGNKPSPSKKSLFFGRNTNYDIIPVDKIKINTVKRGVNDESLFFSSPSKRCKQSLRLITKKKIIEDKRLHEIDYGRLDGVYERDAIKKYPGMFHAWKNGRDVRFPQGENNLDVIIRVKKFLKDLERVNEKNIVICTHNVVLRCIVGSSLGIAVKDWYKIKIPHFKPIKFELINGKIIYKGDKILTKTLLKNIKYPYPGYFVALQPACELNEKLLKTKLEIFRKFGENRYLADPPHCTLYVSVSEDLNDVENILNRLSAKEKKIKVHVRDKYGIFKEDNLAGGGTTLFLQFDQNSNKKISSLQKKIVFSLNNARNNKIHPRYKGHKFPKSLTKNIVMYGFPFFGESFIPHLSFGCFNDPKVLNEIQKIYPSHRFSGDSELDKLVLYRLFPDESIKLIREFKLQ